MKFLFLSDLHLQDGSNPQAFRLVRFLGEVPRSGDTLVLGGDIFDLFVGNKRVFQSRFSEILQALQSAAEKGVNIYYLEGNHDFQLRGILPESGNFRIFSDDFSIEIPGKKIWISHGDLIDPQDTGYRFLRWATRTGPIQKLISCLPGEFIDLVGNQSSQSSRKYNERRVNHETRERLREMYFQFARQKFALGYGLVLVGHSHIEDFRRDLEGTYINLGFSSECLKFASISKAGQDIEIKEFF